jgi:hypothetical protein
MVADHFEFGREVLPGGSRYAAQLAFLTGGNERCAGSEAAKVRCPTV